MLKNANILLKRLLAPYQSFFKNHTVLKVVVIGAGTFPSCEVFLKVISELFPKIQHVSFTLVDPAKNKTDLFTNRIKSFNIFPIKIVIFNQTINQYLKKYPHLSFDIIYFEHPDLRIFPILLNKMFGIFKNTTSLRKSIPYLQNIFNNNALIVASCLSNQEIYQFKFLLKFIFGVKSRLIHLNNKFLYGGYFSVGLIAEVNHILLPRLLEIQSEKINAYDNYLLLSFIFGCLILFNCISHSFFNLIVFLMLALSFLQLLFYRPGVYNIILNILLCFTYSFCLMH